MKPETGGFQAKIAGCDVLREAAADARQDKMAGRAMFVVKQETGGFQDKIARCDVLREVSRRGCPCPIAGRSLRPSLASAHCMPAALRHPACPCRQARLPGHGQPVIHSAARRPARQDAGRSTSERMLAKQKSQDAMFCVKPPSGLSVPHRRTFAAAIPGLRSLHAGCASASCLRLPPSPAPGARAAPRR